MLTGSYRWNPDVSSERYYQGNTEGRPSMRATDASYIAGFMDGDGSIHFQFVRQGGYRFGFYIRASLSLTQRTVARKGLEYLQTLIGAGYLRDRGNGMSDLVITSRPVLIELLTALEPFVIFKEAHVREALRLLPMIRPRMGVLEFLELVREVDAFSALNCSKSKRITAADVEQHLRSMGLLGPRNDFLDCSSRRWDHHRDGGESMTPITRRLPETG